MPQKDTLSSAQLATQYGFALAFMDSDPELKSLFGQAVKGGWDATMFQAKLRNTKWFKTHSANVRNAILMKTSDPATYKENVDKMVSQVKNAWGSTYGNMIPATQLHAWAETAFRMGWSQEQLMDRMGASLNFTKAIQGGKLGGSAGEATSQLRELASQYGINIGQSWLANNVKRVVMGDDTIEGIQSRIRAMAKQEYGAFADQIDAGRTVMEIADPYIQKYADLLELNPADVSLKDAKVQKALTMKNDKGHPVGQSLSDFADSVRSDPRWQYTKNAKQQAADVTMNLLRSFGVSA